MTSVDISRAWKDEEYRLSLDSAVLSQLPENPAGFVELDDSDLTVIAGGSPATTVDVGCWVASIVITGTIAVSVTYCSPNGTFCGSCSYGTAACC